MEFKLPENVTVSKEPKPKNFSYPVKTSEIVLSLNLELPLKIFYKNYKQNLTLPHNQKKLRFENHFSIKKFHL